MSTTPLAAIASGILTALAIAPVLAESSRPSSMWPLPSVFEVYVYACQPVEYDFAGVRQPLSEVGVLIHDQVFAKEYSRSCRDFYFSEIAWRI